MNRGEPYLIRAQDLQDYFPESYVTRNSWVNNAAFEDLLGDNSNQ